MTNSSFVRKYSHAAGLRRINGSDSKYLSTCWGYWDVNSRAELGRNENPNLKEEMGMLFN